MPGSKRYFAYFDDAAVERFVQLDESNAESTDLGFGQSVTASVFANYGNQIKPSSQRPIEMRYILAQRVDADDRIVRRKFYVGSTTAPVWGATARTATIDGELWSITAKVGEKRYLPPQTDTNLIDGDVDSNVTA